MQSAFALMTGFAVALAQTMPAAAEPRAIDPEAARPDLEHPRVWTPRSPQQRQQPRPESAETSPAPPAPEEATPPSAAAPGADQALQPRPQRECWVTKSQCRQLSITGIVFGGLGLAAIAVGTGLALRPNDAIADEPAYERSTRPPGVVSIGMGIGVLLTGVLMLVAGQRAWKLGLDRSLQQPASDAPP